MAAILLKNSTSKAFLVRRGRSREEGEGEQSHVRSRLPSLLLDNRVDDAVAVHQSLALAEVASADFPDCWPTLLEDLVGAASLSSSSSGTGICVARALRRCLQLIRLRKVVLLGGGGGGASSSFDAANLSGMLTRAANERRDVHRRACSIFDALLAGIVGHASAAAFADNPDVINAVFQARWRAESVLAVAYIK
jgi:hypothetical protein